MNNMILEGFETELITSSLTNQHLNRLAREVTFVYGLKIYSAKESESLLGGARLYLCRPDGFPVCELYAKAEEDDKVRYNYYSAIYEKQRGSSDEDRHTISSNKLPVLMATLKKNKVVPKATGYPPESSSAVLTDMTQCVTGGVLNAIRYSVGTVNTNNYIAKDFLHPLLKAMFGELPPDDAFAQVDRTKGKALLDEYNKADRLDAERLECEERVVKGPFYAIGSNRVDGDYIVGICKTEFDENKNRVLHVVKPFKRVKSLYEVEELNGFLTMLKVRNEKLWNDRGGIMVGNDFQIPTTDHFDKDMEVAYAYQTSGSRYAHQWMVIPCTAL